MKLAQRILAASAILAGLSFSVSAGVIEDAINERLAPVGSVCVEGSDCAAATAAAAGSASSEPRTGEAIYGAACTACHDTGAAGAPKLGDAAAWAARTAAGIDTVYANAINGINGMPAMGLCMDCSEDEVKATVDYILANSK